jgi:hypothetical protein
MRSEAQSHLLARFCLFDLPPRNQVKTFAVDKETLEVEVQFCRDTDRGGQWHQLDLNDPDAGSYTSDINSD